MRGLSKTSDSKSRMIKTYAKSNKRQTTLLKIRIELLTSIGLDLYCADCIIAKMSSVPMGTYAAMKNRQNLNNMTIQRMQKEAEQEQYFKKYCMEPTPMKYSSKLMNSIWGMYNRYSVHNFKKNMDSTVPSLSVEGQIF